MHSSLNCNGTGLSKFSDFITGSGTSFQVTPSMTCVYNDGSEKAANFIFAVTELHPLRRLNSVTLKIVAATPPKRQDQPLSYTVSKPTRVSSNYYSIAIYLVRQT
jgi:hypothetical protein